eukprot:Mycagemm_TRINITY_DN8360_c0_g1::TRINITY_DN8360_c0_g1_i1::g.5540::m.5540 type:complete len:380 gc:universal TRINITY_DN8360_c0_g1_i1:68-1207(+)
MAKLWLRAEFKAGERRSPITPDTAKTLIENGFEIFVEHSDNRAFTDEEFAAAGCKLVKTSTWHDAPLDVYILGLKELPDPTPENYALKHKHIYFAHCYKQQGGWQEVLGRFPAGKGLLLDLEFLVDDQGRRVAAFGRPAGTVGAALGLLLWAHQQRNPGKEYPAPLTPWKTEQLMIADVRAALAGLPRMPRVCVIGALGRCGRGSSHILEQSGVTGEHAALWDLAETKKGGPFPELMEYDVVINDIYLSGALPPFVTNQLIDLPTRKTTVIVDVSCDTSNPYNPLPIYSTGTTLAQPVLHVRPLPHPVDVIAIDHLPTLNPRESSDGFAKDLLPHLLVLGKSPVWTRAVDLFNVKVATLQHTPDHSNGHHAHANGVKQH